MLPVLIFPTFSSDLALTGMCGTECGLTRDEVEDIQLQLRSKISELSTPPSKGPNRHPQRPATAADAVRYPASNSLHTASANFDPEPLPHYPQSTATAIDLERAYNSDFNAELRMQQKGLCSFHYSLHFGALYCFSVFHFCRPSSLCNFMPDLEEWTNNLREWERELFEQSAEMEACKVNSFSCWDGDVVCHDG